MKKIHSLILLLIVTLSVHAESVTPYKGSRIFWDTTTKKTVFNPGWYARMIELQDGRLMAACEHSGIDIAFSSNKGNSWTSATKLATNPNGIAECVPDLIQLSDGTIIVAYNPRPQSPYSAERLFGIRCKYSTDNGKTWSDEIFVNDADYTFDNGCWEPSMLELPSGEVQLYFADEGPYTYSGEQQISMCRSYDKGKTWTKAQKVGFRAGSRDGMPVPILLRDKNEIVYAFEDNGWGYGDFFPTTARTTLSNNWNNYWVDANSENRNKMLDLDYCPVACGGAPYLRQMANGETVLSYQSTYNSPTGKLDMLVAVGDDEAKNFKALSHPFIINGNSTCQWNSLCCIDTIVVAVGGVDNCVEMIKGYPKKQFEAAYGSPVIDGKNTRKEGYTTATATQIHMGSELGIGCLFDFAYDADSLYFYARISDRTQMTTGSYYDGINLYLEAAGESDTNPQTTTFYYATKLSGKMVRYRGSGMGWRQLSSATTHLEIVQSSSFYIMEMAIPWSDLGLDAAPAGQDLRTNIIIRNGNEEGVATETIPDAIERESWTWMPLHIDDLPVGIESIHADNSDDSDISISADGNIVSVLSGNEMNKISIYSADGKLVKEINQGDSTFALPMAKNTTTILKLEPVNSKPVTRKINL